MAVCLMAQNYCLRCERIAPAFPTKLLLRNPGFKTLACQANRFFHQYARTVNGGTGVVHFSHRVEIVEAVFDFVGFRQRRPTMPSTLVPFRSTARVIDLLVALSKITQSNE